MCRWRRTGYTTIQRRHTGDLPEWAYLGGSARERTESETCPYCSGLDIAGKKATVLAGISEDFCAVGYTLASGDCKPSRNP